MPRPFRFGVNLLTPASAAEWRAQLTLEDALALPVVPAGPLDDLVARVRAQRKRFGFSYLTVLEHSMEDFAPVMARLREESA
jgi:hypothetical protein